LHVDSTRSLRGPVGPGALAGVEWCAGKLGRTVVQLSSLWEIN
jgi:hypothetical protein